MPFTKNQLFEILASVCEGLFCLDSNGVISFANERCVELLGFESLEQMLDKFDLTKITEHHGEIRSCFADGKRFQGRTGSFRRVNGQCFDVEFDGFPIWNDRQEQIVGAIVTFRNTTIRDTENAHRNQLARLVESSSDAILSKDLEGRITSWNHGATMVYGYEAEEAIGRTVEIILPAGQVEEEAELLGATKRGVELPHFEVKRRTKSGDILDVSITVSPIYDQDGELIGTSSIERDFSERRRSQEELIAAKNAAEAAEIRATKANNSRSEFLANVSHELRTPMNAILGMINLALEEPLSPTVSDYLGTARTSAQSLLELINEILDFSKLESGKFEITSEEFDFREVIDVCAKALSPKASEKGLELLCEIESDVPRRLIGDGRRMQQVLNNLLSNAIKFTDRGEVIVSVRPYKKLRDEIQLEISVIDTGIGISTDDQARIFSPFAQGDMSSTRTHHGTGLGLTICKELISLMGGRLRVESQVGVGSRFFFRLTLPIGELSTPSAEGLPQLVKNRRVLIVDDNQTNLRILEKIFYNWSMQPVVAESGEQALRILEQQEAQSLNIALAVVDGLMPGMDGFTLAEKIVARFGERHPPIVIMQSTCDLAMFSDRKSDSPVDHFLTKPVSQSDLLDVVVNTLNLYTYQSPQREASLNSRRTFEDELVVPLRILLVEDLPANQKVAQVILGKRGHEVVTATNGRVAIDEIQSSTAKYDVVLMDIQMPVMDGLQATAAIRALPDPLTANTPIIAMTAHAMQGDREMCLAAGMDGYLTKPLDTEKLIEMTESFALQSSQFSAGREVRQANGGQPSGSAIRETRVANSSGTSASQLDLEGALKRLGGDRELLGEFIDIFLADAPALIDQIESAINDRQGVKLNKAAHALKGMISNFGATECCLVAKKLEDAGKHDAIDGLDDEFDRLHRYYERLRIELESLGASL